MQIATLYFFVTDYTDLAESYLSKFKWGKTFTKMNDDFLEGYSNCKTSDDVITFQNEKLQKLRQEREADRGNIHMCL